MPTTRQMFILYVDHDPDSCEMMTLLLGMRGIKVECVNGVAQALEFVASSSVDLYLIASRFVDGNGTDLCRTLRHLDLETPIVFYSGDAYESDKSDAFTAGATAFVAKPGVDTIASTVINLILDREKQLFSKKEMEKLATYLPNADRQVDCSIMVPCDEIATSGCTKRAA